MTSSDNQPADSAAPAPDALAPEPAAAEVPLIWTTLGNVPVHALQHQVKWERSGNTIRLGEIYTTSGGLVVRETWHTLPDHLAKDPAA